MLFFYQTPLTKKKERTHWHKNILFALFIFTFLIPQYTFAFSDARCFEEKDCYEKRRELGALDEKSIKGGFKQTPESIKSCGGKSIKRKGKDINTGFCLAAGSVETNIKIGGRAQFDDIVDFIIYIHQYAIIVGGILAMIVVIVAGFQLTASGGNSAIIGSAKKRIAGAITGLIILILSFTILQSINPKTLELVLPKIWLLQGVALSPLKCDETIKSDPIYKLVAKQKEYLSLIKKPKEWQDAIKVVHDDEENRLIRETPKGTECGDRYTHKGIAASCMGTKCKGNEVCGEEIELHEGGFKCHKDSNFYFYIYDGGFVKQDIDPTGAVQEGWKYVDSEFGWISSDGIEEKLYYWCKNTNKSGTFPIKFVSNQGQKNTKTKTVIAPVHLKDAVKDGINKCNGKVNVGFAFKLSFLELDLSGVDTEDDHFIGKNGIDLGDARRDYQKYIQNHKRFPYLLTADDLIPPDRNPTGIRIDVSNITDLDTLSEGLPKAIEAYSHLGLTQENYDRINKEEADRLREAQIKAKFAPSYYTITR